MRRTLIVAALVSCFVAALAESAKAADTAECVKPAEYRAIHKGDAKKRVHRVFDTDGQRRSLVTHLGYRVEIREYRGCLSGVEIWVFFEKQVGGGAFRLDRKGAGGVIPVSRAI